MFIFLIHKLIKLTFKYRIKNLKKYDRTGTPFSNIIGIYLVNY